MSAVQEIMKHNEAFVANKEYERYRADRFPSKKMVIVTCMDTRLVELLPRAMNVKNGDVKICKNAGAIVTQPFGNIMRSILVAIYELGAEEVVVVGHHQCGMTGLNADSMIAKMKERGITDETLATLQHSGIHLNRWLIGFDSVKESVLGSVEVIRNHPLLPQGVQVHGMIIDPETGKLDLVYEDKG